MADEDTTGVSPVIAKMLKRFDLSAEAWKDNRKRFLEAKKFALGGEYQWDPAIYELRGNNNMPRDSYNQIPQFTHQVTNDARMNSTQTKFVPGEDADEEAAEVREDLARNIQSGAEADVAYDTAIENSVEGGYAYWRYITSYENDKTFDQIIKLRSIPNPLVIYDDPNAIENGLLDREFLLEVSDVPTDDFNNEYDREYGQDELRSVGDSSPSWMGQDYVRVAEYWSVDKEKSMLYRDKKSGKITEEKPKNLSNYDSREVVKNKVKWRKCTACEVLEEKDWPGCYIPYVFVAGEEKVVDGKRHLTGLVEHMMAPQRAFNYQSNSVTYMAALAPKSPWIASARAIKGYEEYWDMSNIEARAFLPFNDIDEKGNPINPPQRMPSGVDLAAGITLTQQAQNNFYNVTGIFPASLGKQGNETSGRAINARKVEGEVSTFHYVDNINRGKLAGGLIMNDLITHIYDGSRMVTTMKEDKTIARVPINKPYKVKKGAKTVTKTHDMTVGTYEVMITTGPSYTTKRQETADAMLQLASQTNLMEIAPDIFYKNQDFPGSQEIGDRYKKMLPPQITAGDEDAPEIPPQIQQQMQEMQQVIQQMDQELQAAQGQLNSKALDIQQKEAALQGQLAKNAQDSQSQMLQLEIRAAKAEMAADAAKMELRAQSIMGEQEQLNQLQAEFMENSQQEQEKNRLLAELLSKDLEIKRIAMERENDLANMQLQQDYMDNMQEYEIIKLNLQNTIAIQNAKSSNKTPANKPKPNT